MQVNDILLALIAILVVGLVYKLIECRNEQQKAKDDAAKVKEKYYREYSGVGFANRKEQ